jgi:3-methyladenine DNA glycosylase/8-oxoguanine DNA glycosylase
MTRRTCCAQCGDAAVYIGSMKNRAATGSKPPQMMDAGAALKFSPQQAIDHLAAADPKLAKLIALAGPFTLELRTMHNLFEELSRNIIYQQLHGNAARAIHERVRALFRGRRLRPQELLDTTDEALLGAGLSRAKVAALKDLSVKTIDKTVPQTLARLERMEDEEIIERLITVRGIGRWTVEMLLIFRLGRPDVLPVGDLAIRKGYALAYGLKAMPTPKELTLRAEPWRPFRTVASWYLWRAVELPAELLPV